MRDRCLTVLGALVVASLVAIPVHGQAPAAAKSGATARGWTAPRTPDGQPDLQGVWDYRTVTPMERPPEFASKEVLTEREVAEYEKQQAITRDRDRRDGSAQADVARAYNQFWWDYGTTVVTTRQTSLVVNPPDGRIPPLTPAGQKRAEERRAFQTTSAREEGSAGRGFDSHESRPLAERCLLWGVAGPPLVPGPYNNNVQLFQNRDYVVILNEMIHEHRMVPLDGRPHVDRKVRQWMGDSRGRWEGDTLVVETKNLSNKTSFRGTTDEMHLIERFTRTSSDTLIYEFTVNDPPTFTRPWTARIPMRRSQQPIYEYACHEGNYAMTNGLAGSRNLEIQAAAKGGTR